MRSSRAGEASALFTVAHTKLGSYDGWRIVIFELCVAAFFDGAFLVISYLPPGMSEQYRSVFCATELILFIAILGSAINFSIARESLNSLVEKHFGTIMNGDADEVCELLKQLEPWLHTLLQQKRRRFTARTILRGTVET